MNGNSFSLMRRALLAGILSIVATLIFTLPSFAAGEGLLSGNTEDAVVQIACGDAAYFQTHPITFTAVYQNRSQTVSYNRNTANCPITDFVGEVLRGPTDGGNLQAVSIAGQVIRPEDPARTATIQYPDATAITIRIRVYRYSGSLYIEITISRAA